MMNPLLLRTLYLFLTCLILSTSAGKTQCQLLAEQAKQVADLQIAIQQHLEAAKCFEADNQYNDQGYQLEEVAYLYYNLQDDTKAINYFEQCYQVYEKATYYYWPSQKEAWKTAVISLFWIAEELSLPSEKILADAIDKALEAGSHTIIPLLYANLGYHYNQMGNFTLARKNMEEALNRQRVLQLDAGPLRIFKPLGQIYTRIGDIPKAVSLLNEELDYLIRTQEVVNFNPTANSLKLQMYAKADLGIAYQSGNRFSDALDIYRSAIGTIEDIINQDNSYQKELNNSEALLYQNMAQCYLWMAKIKPSQRSNSLKLAQQAALANPALKNQVQYILTETKIGALHNLGSIYLEDSINTKATEYLYLALDFALNYYQSNPNRREIAKIELNIAELLRRQEQYKEALVFCDNALMRVLSKSTTSATNILPPKAELYPENVILDALTQKGQVYYDLAQHSPGRKVEQLQTAKEYLERALDMEQVLVSSYSSESAKLQLGEDSHWRHELLLSILFDLKDKENTEELIFRYMEQSKAVRHRHQLIGSQALQAASRSVEPALLEEVYDLSQQILEISAAIAQSITDRDPELRDSLERELLQLQEVKDTLIAIIRVSDPKYADIRYSSPNVPLKKAKKLAKWQGGLIVEYFFGENEIFILALSQDKVISNRIPRTKAWQKSFDRLLQHLSQNIGQNANTDPQMYQEFIELSINIYQSLLAPVTSVSDKYSTITLIPDGDLWKLPFEILLSQKPKPTEINWKDLPLAYGKLPYLFKQVPTQYNYSIYNLQQGKSNGLAKASLFGSTKKYHGFAPTYQGCAATLDSAGLKSIQKIAASFNGLPRIGREASLDAFLADALQIDMAHFHGHAFADASSHLNSHLLFSCSTGEDQSNRLFAHTIYGHRIPLDLMALGGCEGATGTIITGEGVMSLGRAFQYAGVKNIILNLWKVEDIATAKINEYFFEHVARGESYAKALQSARIDYLSEDPTRNMHPFIIGGPILIGSAAQTSNMWLYLLGVAGLLLLLFFTLTRKRPARSKEQIVG